MDTSIRRNDQSITTGKPKFPDGAITVREIEKPSKKLKSNFSDGTPPGNNRQG
jgi:hypothetical protein